MHQMCPVVQASLAAKTRPWLGLGSAGGSIGMDTVSATEPSQCWPASPPPVMCGMERGGRGSVEGQPPVPHPTAARPDPVPHHQAAVALGALEQLLAQRVGKAPPSLQTVKGWWGRMLPPEPLNETAPNGRSCGAAGWFPRAALGKSQGLLQAQHWHGTLPPS